MPADEEQQLREGDGRRRERRFGRQPQELAAEERSARRLHQERAAEAAIRPEVSSKHGSLTTAPPGGLQTHHSLHNSDSGVLKDSLTRNRASLIRRNEKRQDVVVETGPTVWVCYQILFSFLISLHHTLKDFTFVFNSSPTVMV